MMGSPEGVGFDRERPQRMVTIHDFEMMQSEVTVQQYRACVEAEVCSVPNCDVETVGGRIWLSCNYAHNRELHPVNHVSWLQMRTFGAWVGADLPTESQWEFAARSRGQEITYPWGDEEPDCTRADWDNTNDNVGCNGEGTSPVCSFPAGDSTDGLCDLAGNVREWVLDEYADSYRDAPLDGSARCSVGDCSGDANRVVRGGNWNVSAESLRAAYRGNNDPSTHHDGVGFRLVKP